jgi:hypothetical protein
VLPPGANGMTSVMLRFGKFWACASRCAPGQPNIIAAQSQIFQTRIFAERLPMWSLLLGRIVVERTDLRNPASTSFRHCEEQSDEAIHSFFFVARWIASLHSQ